MSFYIATTKHGFVGNCVVFWGPNHSGYVTDVEQAGRYTEAECDDICRNGEGHTPIPCVTVNNLSRRYFHADDLGDIRRALPEPPQGDSP